MLATGFLAQRDPASARRLFERVCRKSGNPVWDCGYSRMLERDDYGDGAASKCNSGEAKACLEAGLDTEFGSLSLDRFDRASVYYTKACRLGSDLACKHWLNDRRSGFESAIADCETSGGRACLDSGRILLGYNWNKAIEHLRRGCEDGVEDACRLLEANGQPRPAE